MAAIARERGMPLVTALLGARARLGDGALVRVDGSRGVVEVVAPGAIGVD